MVSSCFREKKVAKKLHKNEAQPQQAAKAGCPFVIKRLGLLPRVKKTVKGGMGMEQFTEFMSNIENPVHRARMEEVHLWVLMTFPNLMIKTAWNQPMFTYHGTFIIAFSAAKRHRSVAPERAALDRFADQIAQVGYERTKELILQHP